MIVWAYREALKDLTVAELERGCADALKRIKFVPTPAEIRDCVEKTRPAPQFAPALLGATDLSEEEQGKIRAEIQEKIATLAVGPKPLIIELTEEELARRKEKIKQDALDWWESQGQSA